MYVPAKRARFGMKLYKLCDDEYTVAFDIHYGRHEDRIEGREELSKTENAVFRLLHDFLGKGHVVYMDRYYSSPTLFDALFREGTLACGTAQPNRKYMPIDLVQTKLPKKSHERIARKNGPVLCVKYADKRDVYMLTTAHEDTAVETEARANDGVRRIPKPTAIVDYNKYMGHVDKTDQMMNAYKSFRKTMKWTKKLANYLFQSATLNAHHLSVLDGRQVSYLKFLLEVVRIIFQERPPEQQKSVLFSSDDHDVRLSGRHFPAKLPPNDRNPNPSKKCRVCTCYTHTGFRKRKETTSYCPMCPSKPGLCALGCFEKYHTQVDFKN